MFRKYPQENARCEWKEFKNQKNLFCEDEITKNAFNNKGQILLYQTPDGGEN